MISDKHQRAMDLELLAPAGGKSQLRAAVENGADAVYLGGRLFNARIKADNFGDDELLWALDYAHLRNVKVYVALNTLITNDELLSAYDYAKYLYEAGVDAFILQDLGFAQMVRKGMPDLRLHLSTQGTVYNTSGVKMAEELGFERVVLARELTLQEIEKIKEECRADIEVFVHGALCICYSGQCQMSRSMGGRSGNRGLCAQPCRLPYNGAYSLSPKDLCTIDILEDLVEAGVKSFKIEGRMKSPEYVATVTSIYRKYLDQYLTEGSYIVDPKDRWALNQIYNRGGFTEGYLHGNPGDKLITEELSKHQGVYLGKIKQRWKNDLIDIVLNQGAELNLGDGIEVRSKDLPGNVVTYIENVAAGVLRIGDIKGNVSPGDKVFKISDKGLNKSARATYEPLSDGSEKNRKKVPVNMVFVAKDGEKITLSVTEAPGQRDKPVENPVTVIVNSLETAEKAINRPTKPEEILKQLSKTGAVPFRVQEMKIHIDENISIPLSLINSLRRNALGELAERKVEQSRRQIVPNRDEAAMSWMKSVLSTAKSEQKKANQNFGITYIPIYDYMRMLKDKAPLSDELRTAKLRPYIYNISKGRLDQYIEENFSEIAEKCKATGIAIGNLGWVKEFVQEGVKVYGDYGLNIVNQLSEETLKELGVQEPLWSLEVIEEWNRGGLPLMITEHMINERTLVGRNGKEYPVLRPSIGDKCIVLSGNNPIRRF